MVLKLNIKPIPGLNFLQSLGYENRQWENHTYNPSYSRTSIEDNHTGSAYLGFSKSECITSEGYFSYANEFKKHSISATAGYSYFEYNSDNFNMSNYNFSVDGVKFWDIGQGTGLADGKASMSSGKDPSEKLFSLFARANYAFDDTYLLSASIRHEGSSKFASKNRWANFWSASAGWRISNEKFMKNISWVEDLKLRVGYGVTGNNNFSSSYMANMLGSDAFWYLPNGNWKKSYGKTQNVNPNLGWEEKKEWNFGIDYSLFGGRLYGKFDYFIRNIDNLLYSVNVPQPPYTQGTQWQNIGKMHIKGWEFEVGGTPVKTKDFTWTSNLNLSHNSGKIKTLWGNNTYFNGNGFPAPGTPGDINAAAVATMKAQLYFNAPSYIRQEKWQECADICKDIIGGKYGKYDIDSDWTNVFGFNNETSPEIIWSVPSEHAKLESDGMHWSRMVPYNFRNNLGGLEDSGSNNGIALTPGLDPTGRPYTTKLGRIYSKFNDQDIRKQNYVYLGDGKYKGMFVVGLQQNPLNPEWVCMGSREYKGQIINEVDQVAYFSRVNNPRYKDANGNFQYTSVNNLESNIGTAEENSGIRLYKVSPRPNQTDKKLMFNPDIPIIRLAEVYYMWAECKMRLGDKLGAADLINHVRKRYFEGGNDPDPVTVANLDKYRMLDEWMMEFVGEGRRRTDLVRWDAYVTESWWDHQATNNKNLNRFPIHYSVLEANQKLEQNPGYGRN